jgi:hypothetical protein
MNENSLITVATYSFPYEAEISRATLESNGIMAFVADAHTINMQWLYSNAMGGVRVQVQRKNFEAARLILNTDYSSLVESEIENDEAENDGAEYKCSKCHGITEPYTKGKKTAFLVFFLLGFPLFFYQHGVKCKSCGHFTKT